MKHDAHVIDYDVCCEATPLGRQLFTLLEPEGSPVMGNARTDAPASLKANSPLQVAQHRDSSAAATRTTPPSASKGVEQQFRCGPSRHARLTLAVSRRAAPSSTSWISKKTER